MKAGDDEQKDNNTNGSSTTVVGDDALPFIPRHEVLTNATKGRARRTKNQPTRLVIQTVLEVPDIRVAGSTEKKIVSDIYQTPPAASTEFSGANNSPTSARILDKSPIISAPGQEASPRPVKSLSRTPHSFSTFLSNPLKEAKSEEPASTKKEAPEVSQRKLIPCSPKLADRYKEKIDSLGELQTALNKKSPMKFNSPMHQNSSNADINQKRSSSLKLNASPKPDFLERRNTLKAVTSPYKAIKDSIAPLNSDKLITYTSESGQTANTPASVAINKGTASSKKVTSTDSTMTNASSSSSTRLSNALVSKETQDTSDNFKEYRDYMENKILCLENNLAVEKLAREHLEKTVEELKLIVTRLDKN